MSETEAALQAKVTELELAIRTFIHTFVEEIAKSKGQDDQSRPDRAVQG